MHHRLECLPDRGTTTSLRFRGSAFLGFGRLARGAEELGKGKYDHHIDVQSGDEIGLFAQRFDSREVCSVSRRP